MTDDTTKRAEAYLALTANTIGFEDESAAIIRALLAERQGWRPMDEAAKSCGLIDIWIEGAHSDGSGTRWADCYYDSICDQWRTSRPGGQLVWVRATSVTHYRIPPSPPTGATNGL